jgi:hypothetical protein
MGNVFKKYHRVLFYSAWLLINLIQASTTELFDDEAYYWIYSRFPEWGYFDHPPMVALLIKAGYAIMSNELGVRLFIILLNTATIFIIEQLTAKKNPTLFYAIAASVAIAHLGGMIAAPDIPLLFFTAAFFWIYRRFLQDMNMLNAILLGFDMARMLYSKYHAVLIIAFTLASNWKLFTKYHLYLAGGVALLLFMPHLMWQYNNDWPSIYYHLFERNAAQYKTDYTLEYIAGQIAITGPVIGWLLIWAALKYKTGSPVERALKFSLVGFFFTFLISTLKGRVEANWTVPALIPLIVLSHQYMQQDLRFRKWLFRSVPFTLAIALMVRIYMMSDVPPSPWIGKDEMHGNKVWAEKLEQESGGLPMVFLNTYQRASKYWFYKKERSFSLNTPFYRRNNFNLWSLEDSLIGKPAYLSVPETDTYFKNFFRKQHWNYPRSNTVNNYFSFSRIFFRNIKVRVKSPKEVYIDAVLTTPPRYLEYFQRTPYMRTLVWLAIYENGDVKELVNTGTTVQEITAPCQQLEFVIPHHFVPGEYTARFCVGSYIPGYPSVNSSGFTISVK